MKKQLCGIFMNFKFISTTEFLKIYKFQFLKNSFFKLNLFN